MCVWERERESVCQPTLHKCVCVFGRVRARERERVCVSRSWRRDAPSKVESVRTFLFFDFSFYNKRRYHDVPTPTPVTMTGGRIYHGCHLAFLKWFARNERDCPFVNLSIFWPFWMLKKVVYFKACFGEIWSKFAIIFEILTSNLVIATNFVEKLCLYFAYYHFQRFGLFKLLMAKLSLFNFSGPGNPEIYRCWTVY